jgi:hypothetical protein
MEAPVEAPILAGSLSVLSASFAAQIIKGPLKKGWWLILIMVAGQAGFVILMAIYARDAADAPAVLERGMSGTLIGALMGFVLKQLLLPGDKSGK